MYGCPHPCIHSIIHSTITLCAQGRKKEPFEDLTVLDDLESLFVTSISLRPCLPSGNVPSTAEPQRTRSEAQILIFPKFIVFEWLWGDYYQFIHVFIHSFTCLQTIRVPTL